MKTPLRVLIVEDSEDDALLVVRVIQKGGYDPAYERVETADAMGGALGREAWDVIISDYKMPRFNGLEALKLYKEKGLDIPFIIVSGTIGEETAVGCMISGAHDYVMKNNLSRLVPAIQRELKDAGSRRECKRAGKTLRESEEKYQRFFMTSIDCVFITSKDGSWIDMNNAAVELFGYSSREEMMQVEISNLYVNTEEREKHIGIIAEHGYCKEYPVDLCRKDGAVIHTLITSVALYDAEKNVIGFQGTIRDITERRQVEGERNKLLSWQQGVNQLQQSLLAPATLEKKLRAVTDSIVSLFDADFSRVWLIQPGDLCEQGCVHADVHEGPHICRDRDRCLHLLASSGRYTHTDGKIHRRVPFGCYKIGRVASDDDHKFLTNDVQNDPRVHDHEWARELGLVSFAGYQLSVPGGKTLGVLALFAKHPISPPEDAILDGLGSTIALVIQRDTAEKSLLNSEEKHRLLFDSAGDAIFVIGKEKHTLAVNQLACERLGYTHEELMSMTVDQVDSPSEAQYTQDRMTRLMERGHLTFETVHKCKDGSLIPTDISARRITWDGQPAIMSICRDISSRKLVEEELKQTLEKLRKNLMGTIHAMSLTVETRDPYTSGHQKRVSNLARVIAQEMGFPNDTVDAIRMAGTIHDIGKISIPAEILSKPGRLTDIEFSLIKVHPKSGYDILKDVELPYPIAEIVLQHHEMLDGSGYPRGLKDGQILLESQIICVADVVEAMASHRPYRPALGIDTALEEIEKNKGILYDAGVVDVCIKLFREKGFSFELTES